MRTASVDGGPVRTSAGYAVLPDHDLSVVAEADTVVVPGVYGGALMAGAPLPGELHAALTAATRLVAICTGAFVVAATGRLDDRPATTHWMHAERFHALHPRVRLDPDVLYVDDGDVLTSAGNAAGIDLLLHVVRRDHGSAVANQVARRRVAAPWRDGGQVQFVDRPVPSPTGSPTAATREWALARLGEPLTLDQLAAHAATSVRTSTRRFREETGLSPQRWLTQQRVALARHLLESTDTAVDRVVADAGFADGDLAAPAPARRDRGVPAGLPAHLPRVGRPSCHSPACDHRLAVDPALSWRDVAEW